MRNSKTNFDDPAEVVGRARGVQQDVDRVGMEARRVRARLQRVVDDHAPALRFAPVTRFDGPLEEVPADVVTDLERVLEEALTNIARHAHARSAEVRVLMTGGVITLRVTDDGIGCAGAPTDGGLADLRRRAAWYDGTLTVEPGPSGGTRLTCTVPLNLPGSLA